MTKVTLWENGFPLCFSESDFTDGDIIPDNITNINHVRKFNDDIIIDASKLEEFYIDEQGKKLASEYPNTFFLKCKIDDELIKTKEGWIVASNQDIIEKNIISLKLRFNNLIQNFLTNYINNLKYSYAINYQNNKAASNEIEYLTNESLIKNISIDELVILIIKKYNDNNQFTLNLESKRITFNNTLRDLVDISNIKNLINDFLLECQNSILQKE